MAVNFDSHVCFPRWLRCSAVVSWRTIGLWVINKHGGWHAGGCPPCNNQKFKHRLQNFNCSRKCSTTKYLIWFVGRYCVGEKSSIIKSHWHPSNLGSHRPGNTSGKPQCGSSAACSKISAHPEAAS